MMKGVDPQKFIDTASKSARPGNMTRPGPEGQPQVTVNTDTVGGVSGIPGIERFEADELDEIVPPVIEHGHEKVMMVLTESEQVPDPLDPSVMMTIEQIEDMDGSMIVDLMKELSKDQEWDRFLAYNARIFLGDHWLYQVETPLGVLLVIRQNVGPAEVETGGSVGLAWDPAQVRLLPYEEQA